MSVFPVPCDDLKILGTNTYSCDSLPRNAPRNSS